MNLPEAQKLILQYEIIQTTEQEFKFDDTEVPASGKLLAHNENAAKVAFALVQIAGQNSSQWGHPILPL